MNEMVENYLGETGLDDECYGNDYTRSLFGFF